MKKSRFSEERIIEVLKGHEAGRTVQDLAREIGVSEATRSKYGGMDVNEAQRLKALEEENRRLKQLVADLSLEGSTGRVSCETRNRTQQDGWSLLAYGKKRHMRTSVRLWFASALMITTSAMAAGQVATVTVEAWTEADEQIRDPQIYLVKFGTEERVGVFHNGRASGIPVGEYSLRVREPGFKWHDQRLSVRSQEVYTKLLLHVANLPTNLAKLNGVIKSASPSDWIKLVPILNSGAPILEAKVRSDGTFELAGIDAGDYFILVIRGSRVVWTKQLSILSDLQVEVVL